MAKVTWIGETGGPEQIEQYGFTFPKGEPVEVPARHKMMAKFKGNRFFEVDSSGDDDDGDLPYNAVHKGRGRYVVSGPDDTPDFGPYTKDEATAKAAELNAEPAKPLIPAGAAEHA